MSGVCPHPENSLESKWRQYTPSQAESLQQDLETLAPAISWINEFVTQTNGDLGRAGVVCPFMPEALRRDMLQYFVVNVDLPADATDNDFAAVIETEVLELRDHFLTNRITDAKTRLFYSYVVVFRGLEPRGDQASLLIERIQRSLKPKFVEKGLMIGEFHPFSNAIGLRNPDFRPLRSPVPLLSMRNMVEVDFAFLSRSYDPAPTRVHFLTSYLHHVGAELGPLSRRKAELALEEAELQVLHPALEKTTH